MKTHIKSQTAAPGRLSKGEPEIVEPLDAPPLNPSGSFTGENIAGEAETTTAVATQTTLAADMTDDEFVEQYEKIQMSQLDKAFAQADLCARKKSFKDAKTLARIKLAPAKFSKLKAIANDQRLHRVRASLPPTAGYSVLHAITLMSNQQFTKAERSGLFTSSISREKVLEASGERSVKKQKRKRFATISIKSDISTDSRGRLAEIIEQIKLMPDVIVLEFQS